MLFSAEWGNQTFRLCSVLPAFAHSGEQCTGTAELPDDTVCFRSLCWSLKRPSRSPSVHRGYSRGRCFQTVAAAAGGVLAHLARTLPEPNLTRNSHTGEGWSAARGPNKRRYSENGRAEVCGECWVAHEPHRQFGSWWDVLNRSAPYTPFRPAGL
jgi:hypothetical protein